MSFILDALRRADAERERGEVPGLHARHFDPVPSEDEPTARSRRPLWIIGGLALALVAALGWILFGHDAMRPSTTVASGTVSTAPPGTTTTAPPPIANPASQAAARVQTPGASATVGVQSPATSASAAATAASRAAARAAQRAAARAATASAGASAPRTRGTPAGEDGAPSTAGSASSAASRIYQAKELPDAIRRELPAFTIGGSTYSSESANRMLMINGQIFHEGDTIARGVVLQQIRPRAAVFAFKGYRYESTF